MAEILSQKELDALILSLTTDEHPAADSSARSAATSKHLVRVYDFNRPDKFSRDQIRTVEMLHENIARLASTYLAAQVRSIVTVVVASVDQMNFEEFVSVLPNPTYIANVSMEPLKGNMFIAMDIEIVLAIIDRLFGGPGVVPPEIRGLTEIEMTIIDRVLRGIMPIIRESWASIVELEPGIETTTSNPSFVQSVPSNEMTVVIRYELRIGKTSGGLAFCLPFVCIESVLPKLSAQNWFTVLRKEQAETTDQRVLDRLLHMDVQLSAVLGRVRLTVKEVLSLEPGDVLLLESRTEQPVELRLEDRQKFLGTIGRIGRRLCVRITEVLKEDETDG